MLLEIWQLFIGVVGRSMDDIVVAAAAAYYYTTMRAENTCVYVSSFLMNYENEQTNERTTQ